MRAAKFIMAALLAAGVAGITTSHASAGAMPSARTSTTEVDATQSDVYHMNFYGGDNATIRVTGDGDTVLTVSVYDQNGNLIDSDSDNDGTGFCQVSWTPSWTGTFTVRVTNHGGVYNHYTLVTN